jgi:hypothetical protein
MWKTVTLVSLCLLAVQLRAEPEIKGSPAELAAYLASVPKLVSITGESELKVPADRALISLKVVTENKALQEASRANQEIRARLLRTLAEQGVPNERVKPSKFSSTPKYGVFREKAKSYRVENTVRITAQDEKEFQAVANLVDAISEVRYESIEFEHSGKDGLKAKALAQAIDKAGEKKKLYEEKLVVKLSPKAFQENSVVALTSSSVQRAYPKLATYTGVSTAPSFTGAAELQQDDHEMPTSFAELIYRAQVAIEYIVEGR